MHRFKALVSIFVESSRMDDVEKALGELDNLEEMFEVTGEADIVAVVSASDTEEFRRILKTGIMSIQGVKGTVSSIVLKNTHHARERLADEQSGGHLFLNPEILAILR